MEKIMGKNKVYYLTVFAIIFVICSLLIKDDGANNKDNVSTVENTKDLEVHYIDVGQGDSILIKFKDEAMLIDAGESVQSKKVVTFLREHNVKSLKYVVATHPHSDHIGGLSDIIYAFETENIILPKVTTTTKTFENLLRSIKDNNVNVIEPVKGNKYNLGDATFTILAPIDKEYENLNNYSVVLRMLYKNSSFMFTGDIETLVEEQILDNFDGIETTVLKVSHHGSKTSSSEAFIEDVSPKICIIEVGKNNTYNHPNESVVSRLKKYANYIYRTDENSNISVYTDGNVINVYPSR